MLDIISLPPEIDTSKSEFENTPPTVNGISHFKPLSTVNRFLSNNTKKSAFCPSSGTGTIAASKSLVILKAPSLLTFLLMLSSIFFAMLSLPNMTVQSSIVDDEMFGRKPISRLTSNLLFWNVSNWEMGISATYDPSFITALAVKFNSSFKAVVSFKLNSAVTSTLSLSYSPSRSKVNL